MNSRISLTKASLLPSELEAMARAVKAGGITDGELTRNFEAEFSRLHGAQGAVATNSCTSALQLALTALEIKPGDEVITSSFTCFAVANAILHTGAVPVLADIECDPARMSYNLDPSSALRRRSARTRAVILPHMFGVPADLAPYHEAGLPVIEDITLSLGARQGKGLVGHSGRFAACSFHESKVITTGEGGMLIARDAADIEKIRALNGWEGEQASMRQQVEFPSPYRAGFNFHLSDAASALGLAQLGRLEQLLDRRRELALRYHRELAGLPGVLLPNASGENIFFRYLVQVPGANIPELLRRFAAKGIEAGRGVYPPLHQALHLDPVGFPVAEKVSQSLLSIPLYPALTEGDVVRVLEASREILGSGGE